MVHSVESGLHTQSRSGSSECLQLKLFFFCCCNCIPTFYNGERDKNKDRNGDTHE